MRHESNWLEYLHLLANEGPEPSAQGKPRAPELRSRMGIAHAPRNRSEWLQAGYTAQLSMLPRVSR